MSVQTYLQNLAAALIPRQPELDSIERSISTLRTRLAQEFGTDIKRQLQFGSSTRGTMLPRIADEHSDVDYMVVFDNAGRLQPQTFLDRLKRFAEKRYGNSEIFQSHPTLVLNLDHIMFELVPAYEAWGTLSIPGPGSGFGDWIATDPNGFNTTLSEKNANNHNVIKPLIRLLKYWNAKNGYVYNSYELEQRLVSQWYLGVGTLRGYFFTAVDQLHEPWSMPDWKRVKVQRAKRIVESVRALEMGSNHARAEVELQKLLPPY